MIKRFLFSVLLFSIGYTVAASAQNTPEELLYHAKVYRELYRNFLTVEIEKYERKIADPRHPYPAKVHYFLGRAYMEKGIFETQALSARKKYLESAHEAFADFRQAVTSVENAQGWKVLGQLEALVCDAYLGEASAKQKLREIAKEDHPALVLTQLGRRLVELKAEGLQAEGVALCEKALSSAVEAEEKRLCKQNLAYVQFVQDASTFAAFEKTLALPAGAEVPPPMVREDFVKQVEKEGKATSEVVNWEFWDASMFRDQAAVGLAHYQQVARANQLELLAEHAEEAVEFQSLSLLHKAAQNRERVKPIWECYQILLSGDITDDLQSKVQAITDTRAQVYLLSELGLAYLRRGQKQKAKAVCELAQSLLDDAAQKQGISLNLERRIQLNPVYRAYALVLAESGAYPEAEKAYFLTFSPRDKLNPNFRFHDPVYLLRYSRVTIALKNDDFGLALNTLGAELIRKYPEAQALRNSVVDLKWLVERGAKPE